MSKSLLVAEEATFLATQNEPYWIEVPTRHFHSLYMESTPRGHTLDIVPHEQCALQAQAMVTERSLELRT